MGTIISVITGIMKWSAKAVITVLQIALEVIRIMLLIFGCILRLFLSLLMIATP